MDRKAEKDPPDVTYADLVALMDSNTEEVRDVISLEEWIRDCSRDDFSFFFDEILPLAKRNG